MNKKFFKPATIERWCVAVYERPQRFGDREKYDMVRDLLGVCNSVGTSDGRRCDECATEFSIGIRVLEQDPIILNVDPQSNVHDVSALGS